MLEFSKCLVYRVTQTSVAIQALEMQALKLDDFHFLEKTVPNFDSGSPKNLGAFR